MFKREIEDLKYSIEFGKWECFKTITIPLDLAEFLVDFVLSSASCWPTENETNE